MKKRYVAVDAHWTKDGVMTPTAIYWVNPDIISHIEINFRKLIKKNMRQ